MSPFSTRHWSSSSYRDSQLGFDEDGEGTMAARKSNIGFMSVSNEAIVGKRNPVRR